MQFERRTFIHKYRRVTFLQTGQKGVFTILTFTTSSHGEVLYLTDRDADVEELTEEEAESILIELVVNMLQIIFQ